MERRDLATELERRIGSQRRRLATLAAVLLLALAAVSLWRLSQGSWHIPPGRLWLVALGRGEDPLESAVFWRLRLPRLLAALGTGGLLSLAGAVLQGLLANPLAEPYTLGIAAGAALGASTAIFFGWPWVTIAAFLGALVSLAAVSSMAWRSGGGPAELALAGIVVSSILSAGVTLMKALAGERLEAMVLWLMGSFSGATARSAAAVWLAASPLLVLTWALGDHLDALSLGQGRGALLGLKENRLRGLFLVALSLGTAVVVAHFGIIGFVGLVAPQLLRLAVTSRYRALGPLAFFGGALLMAASDGLAQNLGELPVGVLTALMGGPLFCRILIRSRR